MILPWTGMMLAETAAMAPKDKPPRVCIVSPMALPLLAAEYGHHGAGGAEVQAVSLARALARRNFRVSMVVNDYGQPDGARWHGVTTFKAYGPDDGIPVVRFVHPRWTSTWAAMRRADADIYYINCHGMQVGQVALFARTHGRKSVYRVTSDADCSPETLIMRYWRDRRLFAYGLRRVDLVLAQTARQQIALRRNFGRDSLLTDSFVDSSRNSRPLQEREIDVLWVGNFRALKRPELLLELAKRLSQLRFHMVGGAASESPVVHESARRAAAELPNVRFHGLVPYHHVGEFYERARVLVSTSAVEGMPNTYLQAWASGTPVVAFLDPDSAIASCGLGRVAGSLDEMQSAVAALCADPVAWAAASARCIEYTRSRYEEARVVAPYIDALIALHAGADAARASRATAQGIP